MALASPIFAGSVYVPLATDVEINGIRYETRVWVSNQGTEDRRFSTHFLAAGSDGTDREGVTYQTQTVLGGRTMLLTGVAPAGGVGLLEVDGAPQVVVNARLVSSADGAEAVGANLPILSSETLIPAGQEVNVQAWERADLRVTDFALVNLAKGATSCDVDVIGADGSELVPGALVPLAPLSMIQFRDVLNLIGHPTASSVRARVSCDQTFYTFATTFNPETGEVTFIGPSETLASELTRPGAEPPPPPPPPPSQCPQGAICFTRPGVFYVPTPAQSILRLTFPLDTGAYSTVHFRVEVTHGGWKPPTDGLHSLWWLAVNRHYRLVGFSGFHGPNKNDILFRHGMNMLAHAKPKFVRPFVATPGATYVCDYVWDPVGRHVEYTVSDPQGNVLLSITDQPNVNRLHIEEGEDLVADFSTAAGFHPAEPPTYGWQYKNLTLEVYP
jgi:hypothetical protein